MHTKSMSNTFSDIPPAITQGIKCKNILYIIATIKRIQSRMKDSDMVDKDFVTVYNKLAHEFVPFSDDYAKIFDNVVKGKNINQIANLLFYKDRVDRGLTSESVVSNVVAERFLPTDLKTQSDIKIREMQQRGEL